VLVEVEEVAVVGEVLVVDLATGLVLVDLGLAGRIGRGMSDKGWIEGLTVEPLVKIDRSLGVLVEVEEVLVEVEETTVDGGLFLVEVVPGFGLGLCLVLCGRAGGLSIEAVVEGCEMGIVGAMTEGKGRG
jgi:hypothetical protein